MFELRRDPLLFYKQYGRRASVIDEYYQWWWGVPFAFIFIFSIIASHTSRKNHYGSHVKVLPASTRSLRRHQVLQRSLSIDRNSNIVARQLTLNSWRSSGAVRFCRVYQRRLFTRSCCTTAHMRLTSRLSVTVGPPKKTIAVQAGRFPCYYTNITTKRMPKDIPLLTARFWSTIHWVCQIV